MLKMVEAYHSVDNTPLFIMMKTAGQEGHIQSDGLSSDDFVIWPERMIDDFLHIANELHIGEIASYGMCVDECIFCDTVRERLRQK